MCGQPGFCESGQALARRPSLWAGPCFRCLAGGDKNRETHLSVDNRPVVPELSPVLRTVDLCDGIYVKTGVCACHYKAVSYEKHSCHAEGPPQSPSCPALGPGLRAARVGIVARTRHARPPAGGLNRMPADQPAADAFLGLCPTGAIRIQRIARSVPGARVLGSLLFIDSSIER